LKKINSGSRNTAGLGLVCRVTLFFLALRFV
jgi:hypothetical protein